MRGIRYTNLNKALDVSEGSKGNDGLTISVADAGTLLTSVVATGVPRMLRGECRAVSARQ